ncbi:SDR family oxidoreductase [Couchioplanes caeruleus]|uniref:SDR family NAD(P)-dependent oxidoreductase n=1 Tax=Couchioplanes caeruleus TaxID=56438 RepID=UPI0020BF26F9|nr:SDR family oxidoreductase [Couchioplanes caeruleus]UQU64411.1 SDR family oxidoreductase [Couchioplanes caeruleus]
MPEIALITGGNRGLGRASALALAEAGIDAIITYRNGADEAAEVVDAVKQAGRTAVALRLDTREVDTFDAFTAEIRETLRTTWNRDTFDHLLNNAGVGLGASIADTTVAAFDELVGVHLRGVFFLTQKLLPLIADGGRIINFSTGLTRSGADGPWAAYAAAKGAVEVFTRYLAREVGPRGITANVVAPGPIGTDFAGGVLRDDENVRAHLAAQAAMGRMGRPEDVGGAIAALLTGRTGWITAQRIEVSGGIRL